MRLIDADALIEDVWHSGLGSRQDCVNLIKEMPTEEERPHGEWIEGIIGYHYCSECHNYALADDDDEVLSDFCPNCGASMRVKDELNRVSKELNSEIGKSKSEIVPDYRDGWRLREGEAK